MEDWFKSSAAFLAILNPFALCLYLWGVMEELTLRDFFRVLMTASLVSLVTFLLFATMGDYVLQTMLNISASALRFFGGIIFGVIAYKYVSRGYKAVEMLRGSLDELPSAIAVPFMIGAGTITQAILIGKQHNTMGMVAILAGCIVFSILLVMLFYAIHAKLKRKRERVFDRYVNLLARINGLLLGAFSVEMVFESAVEMVDSMHAAQ